MYMCGHNVRSGLRSNVVVVARHPTVDGRAPPARLELFDPTEVPRSGRFFDVSTSDSVLAIIGGECACIVAR